MTRVLDLLNAVSARLGTLRESSGQKLFRDLRVELDRYELDSLVKQSLATPAARICFLRGAPKLGAQGGYDLEISVALVLVASRAGRPTPEIASADAAVLELMLAATGAIAADPWLGLPKIGAARLGDQLVAVSEEASEKGVAIGVLECAWTLLETIPAPAPVRGWIGGAVQPSEFQIDVAGTARGEPLDTGGEP